MDPKQEKILISSPDWLDFNEQVLFFAGRLGFEVHSYETVFDALNTIGEQTNKAVAYLNSLETRPNMAWMVTNNQHVYYMKLVRF